MEMVLGLTSASEALIEMCHQITQNHNVIGSALTPAAEAQT